MFQKKNLVKVINGPKLKEFLMTREPNLIPKHLNPRCHEMPMQVTIAFPVPVTKPSKITTPKGIPFVRKPKLTKCYYLSDAELEYYQNNLETDNNVPLVPEWGKINTDEDPSTLQLNKWLPWQSNLQPRLEIKPSTLTSNYVEILQFVQEQQDDLYGNYHEQMTSFQEADLEHAPPLCVGENDTTRGCVVSNTSNFIVKETTYPVRTNRGLYSPSFLNLFNPISVQSSFPDIPTPPPSLFSFSPEKHDFAMTSLDEDDDRTPISSPVFMTKQERESRVSDYKLDRENVVNTSAVDLFQDSCNFDIDFDFNVDNISMAPAKTPTKSPEIQDTSITVASPILSQRSSRTKLPLKRKLDMTDPDLIVGPDKRHKTETPADSNTLKQPLETAGTSTEPDESILTVSQIVNLVSSPTTFFENPKQELIQPNFELEVDFIDSSQSESELESMKFVQNKIKQKMKTPSPSQSIMPKFELEIDFIDSSQSESELEPLKFGHKKAEKQSSPIKVPIPESPVLSKRRPAAVASFQADFSLGMPNLSNLEDEEEKPIKGNGDSKTVMNNVGWDECFALSASDLEDIEAAENVAAAQSTLPDPSIQNAPSTSSVFAVPRIDVKPRPSSPPVIKVAVWNSSGIRREIEDIFEKSEDSEIMIVEPPEKSNKLQPPVVLLDSENDEDFIEATPPKAGNLKTARSVLESDDESPLVCRRLNPGRMRMLQTQSTPIDRKQKSDRVRSGKQISKKSARAFIEEEADLSLIDGSCSEDEIEPPQDMDQYEGSFVDDQQSHNVSEKYVFFYHFNIFIFFTWTGFEYL